MRAKKQRLGDVLLEKGVVTPEDLDRALLMQRQHKQRLGEILVSYFGVNKATIASAIEQVQGVKYAECPPDFIAPQVLALIPRATAVKCRCIPLELKNNVLVVAISEPQNLDFIDEIRFRCGKQVSTCFSYREDIDAAIRRFYDTPAPTVGNPNLKLTLKMDPVKAPPAPVPPPEAVPEPELQENASPEFAAFEEPLQTSAPGDAWADTSAEDQPQESQLLIDSPQDSQSTEVPRAEVTVEVTAEVIAEVTAEPEPETATLVGAEEPQEPEWTAPVVALTQEPIRPASPVNMSYASPQEEPMPESQLTEPQLEVPENPALRELEFVARGPWTGRAETRKEFSRGAPKRTPGLCALGEILLKALEVQGTALYLEPQDNEANVRIHAHSSLCGSIQLPADSLDSAILMIKTLSGLSRHARKAEIASFRFASPDRRFEIRVSVLPTHFGERAYLQLIESQPECLSFTQLGFAEDQLSTLESLLSLPQGLILVAGPPGSGRTSVLSAMLSHLQAAKRNVVAIEDAAGYVLDGVTHIELGSHFDRTLSGCLRTVLRQDSEVVVIGELPDATTAELAIRASRCGRLIVAAILADDCADAVSHLRDFGLSAHLIASINGMVSSRTVRTRCSCRREMPSRGKAAARCELCRNTGYSGITGVYEVLPVEGTIRAALEDGSTLAEIRDILRGTAVRTLHEDAMEKVALGVTTLDEVLRVLPKRKSHSDVSCRECSEPLSQIFKFCPYCGCPVEEAAASLPAAV